MIEGCGAGRAELAGLADLVVWVQSDRTEARTRGLVRDASYGTRTPAEAEAFWDDWMTEEEPFLAADRPWERAASSSSARRRTARPTTSSRCPNSARTSALPGVRLDT